MVRIVKLQGKESKYTDSQVVQGLQSHNRNIENWFYNSAKRYFNDSFNEVFFDKDRKQEIFQMSFLKIWTEIDNRTICLVDDVVNRKRRDGSIMPMTCSLTTFLMAFAKNEYRELTRKNREEDYADVFDFIGVSLATGENDDIEGLKIRIVDNCIQQVSPSCIEILTMFYYKNMSLDEILEQRKDRNSSKNGLKTAKNKCMNTLRGMVTSEFKRFHIKI